MRLDLFKWWGGVMLVLVLAACAPSTAVEPTPTPRPTLAPRTPPTPIPTAVVAGALIAGESAQVELPGQTFVELLYTADSRQQVTITAQALTDDGAGNSLDVILEILNADLEQIAYNDDGGRTAEVADLAPTDALLSNVWLEPGRYTVRINAFNGFQRGQIEVTLTVNTPLS